MHRFNNIEFANPAYLYLLLLIPLLVLWYWFFHRQKRPTLQLPVFGMKSKTRKDIKVKMLFFPYFLRLLSLIMLIFAIARPQSSSKNRQVSVEGIDIIMAIDISSSMLAEDLKPNRLKSAKNVSLEFIDERPNDRIGLVVFSGEAFTQCPLTTDHNVLKNLYEDIKSGMIEDGTAIGDGLATAVNRLKDSKAVSKVVILLTDGENNKGSVDPVSAAELAQMNGIRVYTIGVGTKGKAPYPVQGIFGRTMQYIDVKIDEKLLKEVASITKAKYFRATNNKKLEAIYEEINQMEKSKIDVIEYTKKHEEFYLLAFFAILLLCFEFVFRNIFLKTIP